MYVMEGVGVVCVERGCCKFGGRCVSCVVGMTSVSMEGVPCKCVEGVVFYCVWRGRCVFVEMGRCIVCVKFCVYEEVSV